MRKRTRIAVMEVSTQVAGVRTRSRTVELAAAAAASVAAKVGMSSRRKAAAPKDGSKLQMAYLQLRSRILVMTKRKPKSARNSRRKRFGNAEQGGISRCSSFASCELVEEEDLRLPSSGKQKICEDDLRSSVCCLESNRDCWRDVTASSNHVIDSSELELDSSAERNSRQSMPPSATASISDEIDEFFAAAEKSEKHRFASMYNFDIDEEVPLEGRYHWVRINP